MINFQKVKRLFLLLKTMYRACTERSRSGFKKITTKTYNLRSKMKHFYFFSKITPLKLANSRSFYAGSTIRPNESIG